MPTYQYACTECAHSFERFQSFTDDALTVCPQCQGRLRKVFNAVGVVFKGSGFYRTDSRTAAENGKADAKPANADTAGSGSKDGESSSGASSPSPTDKPAAKVESTSTKASRTTDSPSAA